MNENVNEVVVDVFAVVAWVDVVVVEVVVFDVVDVVLVSLRVKF